MTREDRFLYHQIHPLKLLTDWTAGFAALPLLWRHRLGAALVVAVAPSVLASLLVVRYVNLEPYQRSAFGGYIERHMTKRMQGVRLAGYLVMMLGAWYRRPWLIPLGVLVVLFGWFRGMLISQEGLGLK